MEKAARCRRDYDRRVTRALRDRAVLCRLLLTAAALGAALAARRAEAQYCIGSTVYAVRDESGVLMSPAQLRRLEVVSVNGHAARLRHDDAGSPYYEAQFEPGHVPYQIRLANPLLLASIAQCGEIDELVLRYQGRLMHLRFGVAHHNTRYHIDSLPFQPGTFRLTGGSLGGRIFPCTGGGAPPLIDNENYGECHVVSGRWERAARATAERAPAPGR
jgi:hypothetical protein